MKKEVEKRSEDDLAPYPLRGVVEGWFFRVTEVSNGWYRVEGTDRWGRQVSRMGSDPEELLEACKRDVEEMEGKE